MTTVRDLLRENDPIRHDPLPPDDRVRVRRAVAVAAVGASTRPARRRRSFVTAAIAAAAIMAAVAAARIWTAGATLHAAAVTFEARLAELTPAPGLIPAHVAGSNQTIYLHQDAVVTNDDVARAQVVPGRTASEFHVAIVFTPEGAQKMQTATGNHLGQPLALLIDGDVVMAPTIRAAVSSEAILSGNYTRAEADRIAAGMMAR